MEDGALLTWSSPSRSRVFLLSTLVAVGGIVFFVTDWFIKERRERKRRENATDNKTDQEGNSSSGDGIEQLKISIKTLEDVLLELSSSRIFEDNNIDVTQLRQNIINLKALVGRKRCEPDLEQTSVHGLEKKLENSSTRDLMVATNEKTVCLTNIEIDDSVCSDDSFVSAAEFMQLEEEKEGIIDGDLQICIAECSHLELYKAGVAEYTNVGIRVRNLRTELLQCENDADFKIKVYCIRNAFKFLFKNGHKRHWFLELGRNMLLQFLTSSGKDHMAFKKEFDSMISYCQDTQNWDMIEEELRTREVCEMSFYDIVLDFIIMDAFEDLANPPSTLVSIINNGWISNTIKETALSTAVWSLLKAKASLLTHPDNFMSRMYRVSQHITPVLVWGFLGPVEHLKQTCYMFKDSLLGFLVDIFSVDHANYSTTETLADSIVEIARKRAVFKTIN